MAQHDFTIADQNGASFLIDLNNVLSAIVSNNSGATEPATKYAYQFWCDTTTGLLKVRNAANSAWVTVGTLASTNLGLATLASPTLTGTPAAPTAAVNTNTTQIATTAFVIGQATSAAPLGEASVAAVGVSTKYARDDHVHPQRKLPLATVNTTSGTSVVISTVVPSWAKKITLIFLSVSTIGTSGMGVQIGTASGLETTLYNAESSTLTTVVASSSWTNGFIIRTVSAAASCSGVMTLYLVDSVNNKWVSAHTLRSDVSTVVTGAGDKTLAGVLTRVSLISTDTFDGGAVGIMWE